MKLIMLLMTLCVISTNIYASNIAFGHLKGIKVYDHPSDKTIRLYFNADATHKELIECQGVASITISQHDQITVQQMLSVAMAGYMAGKKVRAYSSVDTCEADFISIQETYF